MKIESPKSNQNFDMKIQRTFKHKNEFSPRFRSLFFVDIKIHIYEYIWYTQKKNSDSYYNISYSEPAILFGFLMIS